MDDEQASLGGFRLFPRNEARDRVAAFHSSAFQNETIPIPQESWRRSVRPGAR